MYKDDVEYIIVCLRKALDELEDAEKTAVRYLPRNYIYVKERGIDVHHPQWVLDSILFIKAKIALLMQALRYDKALLEKEGEANEGE